MSNMSRLNSAFETLRNRVRNVNVYRSPYVNPSVGTITDKFGSFTIRKNGDGNSISPDLESWQSDAVIIKNGVREGVVDCLPVNKYYVNLRNDVDENYIRINTIVNNSAGYSDGIIYGLVLAPYTLILPYKFSCGMLEFYVDSTSFRRGIYLNTVGANVLDHESWIYNTAHIDDKYHYNKVTVDFDEGYNMTPMYLNRLYLSTKTFENLAHKLGTVTNGKLYLGSKNIANMSTAQKNAIIAKGWTIY